MKNLNNKPSRQKPGYLFSNRFLPLLIKQAKKLPNRFKFRINIKSVLSKFPRYTRYVRRFPCKDVPIPTDELDERAFLFRIQISTDAELFR